MSKNIQSATSNRNGVKDDLREHLEFDFVQDKLELFIRQ